VQKHYSGEKHGLVPLSFIKRTVKIDGLGRIRTGDLRRVKAEDSGLITTRKAVAPL